MTKHPPELFRLEQLLARLLYWGTWVASAIVAAGLVLAIVDQVAGMHDSIAGALRIVAAGIAGFILLPVVRVVLMLIFFFRARDYRLGLVAAVVLLFIIAGLFLGFFHRAVQERSAGARPQSPHARIVASRSVDFISSYQRPGADGAD
jgi:uncharacterized membrane protein